MLPTSTPPAALSLTADDLEALDKARGWAKFIAIISFILCGLFGVVMLLAVVAMTALPRTGAGKPGGAPAAVMGVVTLFGVGFWLAYAGLVMRYASGVAKHVTGDGTALARAFWSLKVLWIISVVSYALSILFTIGMMVAQMLGLTPATPVQP